MDKNQYLLEAIQTDIYKKKEWLIRIFSITRDIPFFGGDNDYPYKIVRNNSDPERLYFIDPQADEGMTLIDGSSVKQALFKFSDRIDLEPNSLPIVKEKINVPLGNVIVNLYTMLYPFGGKFPFMTGPISAGRLEKFVSSRLVDNPKDGDVVDLDKISIKEYLLFCEGVSALNGIGSLCIPSASPKSLVIDPAVLVKRDELLEKYKDQLNDEAILANIDAELVKMDKASFKGDPAEKFFISGKAFAVTRKNLFVMQGLEPGMGGKPDLIKSSYAEGWNLDHFPKLVENSRAASFNRGHQTQLGGAQVKDDYRRFQNVKVIMDDCGSKEGLYYQITDWNYKTFVSRYAYDQKSDKLWSLTEEYLKANIGKYIMLRSPVCCKATAPSYCVKCVGNNIARMPNGIHIVTSGIGSVFMNTFMKAMHGKVAATARYNYKFSIT